MCKRPIGSPKIHWKDDVLEDINSMNVRNWKNVAQNRDRQKKVVEQAKRMHPHSAKHTRFTGHPMLP
jgi:uncharacterized coiled-coil protein SlyX